MRDLNSEGTIIILFEPDGNTVRAPTGVNLYKAALRAGNVMRFECGGNGKCGKCRMVVKDQAPLTEITVHELRHLSSPEIEKGYRLACQVCVNKNVVVFVPPESRVELRKFQATGLERPLVVDPSVDKFHITLQKPTLLDARSDFERLVNSLNNEYGLGGLEIDHGLLKILPKVIREAEWDITVTALNDKIIAVEPGDTSEKKHGLAVDLGTSKIVVYLVDLVTGETRGVGSVENSQIIHGEDLITRISYTMAEKKGLIDMQSRAVKGINDALRLACREANIEPVDIYEATVVGNTVMHHFLLAIEPRYISFSPFTPATNRMISIEAKNLGIEINPNGVVNMLPIIAGFIGSDAIADILSSGISESKELSLLLDIGTNTEIILGNDEGLIACSSASGPAFEGGHIRHGMKAVTGAIERISITPVSLLVEYETIGGGKPRGLCGSAMIDVVAELWNCRLIDGTGKFDLDHGSSMLKVINGRPAFVLVSKDASATGQDIVVTQGDINEIQRAKAAIYAGASILLKRKGLRYGDLERILIAGAFGRNLNPESARRIGLVPDLPTDKIRFVGNTAITGAKMALISKKVKEQAKELSKSVNYLELSADSLFSFEFASALFIPHKDLNRFQSVKPSVKGNF